MKFIDPNPSLNKNLKYKLFPSKTKEREYWKNFEINIDNYCDKWSIHKTNLEKELIVFSQADLKKICSLLNLTPLPEESNYKETLFNDIKLENPRKLTPSYRLKLTPVGQCNMTPGRHFKLTP